MSWIPADVFRQKGEEQRPRSQRASLSGKCSRRIFLYLLSFRELSRTPFSLSPVIVRRVGIHWAGARITSQYRAAAETDRHFSIRCSFCSEPFSSSPVPVIPSTGNLSVYRSPPTVDRLRISRLTCAISYPDNNPVLDLPGFPDIREPVDGEDPDNKRKDKEKVPVLEVQRLEGKSSSRAFPV